MNPSLDLYNRATFSARSLPESDHSTLVAIDVNPLISGSRKQRTR